jgi:hypothetical protein
MAMRDVRIVLVHDQYTDYDDSKGIMQEGVSDWEQISDADFKLLQTNWWRLCGHLNVDNARLVLLEKDRVPVRTRIDSIKAWLEQERARQEQEEAAKRAKAEERARKKLLKNAESELRLLEELRKKYPDAS